MSVRQSTPLANLLEGATRVGFASPGDATLRMIESETHSVHVLRLGLVVPEFLFSDEAIAKPR